MHLIYLGCDHHKMSRYKFVFFSPVGHTQRVLSALFNSVPRELGAIGLYQECAFVSKGTGQFRPMAGANPSIGGVGQAETVEEEKGRSPRFRGSRHRQTSHPRITQGAPLRRTRIRRLQTRRFLTRPRMNTNSSPLRILFFT
ncbi:hypothetical protein V565_112760 [Rhizoctonia solani 123E]|uniref:ATP phosphoribosyltransferase n=1 Tax=Rhizoctonia solani 123E TaxID=1423351 RepID=A0A074RPB5_9AGAM|nr:hypothetical protein V565_112760 [Rhizoctonia solani 123E]